MLTRRLSAPFIVTVTSLGLSSSCGNERTNDDDDDASSGTDTQIGVGTGTATDAGTEECKYKAAADCSGAVDDGPCGDYGEYCVVSLVCGKFPAMEERYLLCGTDGTWFVTNGDFVPECQTPTGTMTSTTNPPAPCPCGEPVEGSGCGGLWGQVSPCTFAECEQWVCDPFRGTWAREDTCP